MAERKRATDLLEKNQKSGTRLPSFSYLTVTIAAAVLLVPEGIRNFAFDFTIKTDTYFNGHVLRGTVQASSQSFFYCIYAFITITGNLNI